MAIAKADGFYTLPDASGRVHHFVAVKGAQMPEGAEVVEAETAEADAPKKRKKQAKTGPSETTESASEPETT